MEQILSYIPLDIALIAANFDRFLYGVWMTLNLTVLALILGGLLAIPMAIARAARHPVLNPLVWSYTYVLRGTPLLVQTYLIYYGLGQFEAVRQSWLWEPVLSSAWWCALIAFTLNTAAYTTELLRGAIVDTPAARSKRRLPPAIPTAAGCGGSSCPRPFAAPFRLIQTR